MQEMLFPIELPLKAPIMQIEIWDEEKLMKELVAKTETVTGSMGAQPTLFDY